MSSTAAEGGLPPAPATASRTLAVLQRIGRSLMMPIAVLPAAAIFLRLGQPDMLGTDGLASVGGFGWMASVAPIVGAAGGILFDYLPLLFAVGVAIGFARRSDGSTALAAVVGYLVFNQVSLTMFADSRIQERVWTPHPETGEPIEGLIRFTPNLGPTGVIGGILIGLMAALLWQRYHRVKLPAWLAFFGGRRFVPIVTAGAAFVLAVIFGLVWPFIGAGINAFGEWIMGAGAVGAGVYGAVNRLLIPFGLHHIVNTLIWFVFGEFEGVQGEINRYFAGDPDAGSFLAGFFPVIMFGLPAAALAIWRAAPPERRAAVGGIMFAGALTAFVTGITEPIEFSFIFIAPLLFAVHIVLTGISMFVVAAFGGQLGFGFSAGAIDFLLNFRKDNSEQVLGIVLMGLAYAVVYYFVFYFLITKLNILTPGREPGGDAAADADQLQPERAPASSADAPPSGPGASPS
ncbi:MAG: PTS sugar transporter subunit IIA [Streptosporangiales bacterium]|nr:PTS sugar transporter subunit IIA [Streptosporangiales bacterium]